MGPWDCSHLPSIPLTEVVPVPHKRHVRVPLFGHVGPQTGLTLTVGSVALLTSTSVAGGPSTVGILHLGVDVGPGPDIGCGTFDT